MQRLEHVEDLDTAKKIAELALKENARLQRQIMALTERLAKAEGKSEPEQLKLELQRMHEQMAQLQRRVFGDSSERRAHEKLAGKKPKPKRGHGPTEQVDLPEIEVKAELAQHERACPACGKDVVAVDGMTEDSQVITVLPPRFVVQNVRRQKYRCTCNGAIVTAPAPIKPVQGGRYSLDFAVKVAVDKYADHLPLERQVRIMDRFGLRVGSQTLWDQLDALAKHLNPTYEALREYIVGSDVVGADETWWRLMGKKSNKRWWAWGLTTANACWYRLEPSRSAKTAAKVLERFAGTVLCDGYGAYETLEKSSADLRLAHCWAHARRYFLEAEDNYPDAAGDALVKIGELFLIESQLTKPHGLEGDAKAQALRARAKAREQQSRPIVESLRKWAREQRGLPQGSLRKATKYVERRWDGLSAFLDDPEIEIDNNGTERALRGMVLGRKNHYGSRSERGTQVAALFYSLVESAKLCQVDPAAYLRAAAVAAITKPGTVLLPHDFAS